MDVICEHFLLSFSEQGYQWPSLMKLCNCWITMKKYNNLLRNSFCSLQNGKATSWYIIFPRCRQQFIWKSAVQDHKEVHRNGAKSSSFVWYRKTTWVPYHRWQQEENPPPPQAPPAPRQTVLHPQYSPMISTKTMDQTVAHFHHERDNVSVDLNRLDDLMLNEQKEYTKKCSTSLYSFIKLYSPVNMLWILRCRNVNT